MNCWVNFSSDTTAPSVQLNIRTFWGEQREARRLCPQLGYVTAHGEQQRDTASLKPSECVVAVILSWCHGKAQKVTFPPGLEAGDASTATTVTVLGPRKTLTLPCCPP